MIHKEYQISSIIEQQVSKTLRSTSYAQNQLIKSKKFMLLKSYPNFDLKARIKNKNMLLYVNLGKLANVAEQAKDFKSAAKIRTKQKRLILYKECFFRGV